MIGKVIGQVMTAEAFAKAFHVVPPKRPSVAATQSTSEAIIASIKLTNKRPAAQPQWGRRLVSAYERGERGIIKHTEAHTTRFIIIGRATQRLPNIR